MLIRNFVRFNRRVKYPIRGWNRSSDASLRKRSICSWITHSWIVFSKSRNSDRIFRVGTMRLCSDSAAAFFRVSVDDSAYRPLRSSMSKTTVTTIKDVKRLDTLKGGVLDSADLAVGFEFRGERIPLINPQRGIFKPRQMSHLLSIKIVFPRRRARVGCVSFRAC